MTTAPTVSTNRRHLPLAGDGRLGVLSLHLDGTPCRVGCEFCYLGARAAPLEVAGERLSPSLVGDLLAVLDFDEVAVALSEPVGPQLPALAAIVRAAARRGRPVAVTTTAAVLVALDEARAPGGDDPLRGVARVNLSVDPRKGPTEPRWIAAAARRARGPAEGTPREAAGPDGPERASPREVALIASLVDEEFAGWLIGGGLAALVALPEVDRVALHGLKPPPPWCDRRFWLRALARLAPLLDKHLDRRLFLDCYVAARILDLGGCPARPDVSPGDGPGRAEFRACVYQPAADLRFSHPGELTEHLRGFTPPARCPFPID